MSAPANHRGLFAQQLARAAAQRGRLDRVYQVLSDHYSTMAQRLYPVWVLIGPGLADPAHIEVHSRTVALDSDRLLGTRQEIAGGQLDPFRILISFGALFHEIGHGAHTKPWIVERNVNLAAATDPAGRQLAEDRVLLEEPRMEATTVRDYPASSARGRLLRKALRAAVADIIAPEFCRDLALTAVLGQPVTRDMCGRAMTYLHARTHCGTIDPAVLAPLEPIWRAVLGEHDTQALDDLYTRLVWVEDGDNDALDAIAREYRQIIGPPPPATGGDSDAGAGEPGCGAGGDPGGTGRGAHSTTGPAAGGDGLPAGALRDALRDATDAARDRELRQFNEDISLKDLVAQQAGQAAAPPPGKGRGTGRPTGSMPDRGVNRPPLPDEVAQAVQYGTRLERARARGTSRISKRTPGGRFNARQHMRGSAQRHLGVPVTSHPWEIQREIKAPLLEPHVGLIEDNSGSMCSYEYALGPIVWKLDHGLRRVGGKLAVALFGNGCELLCNGNTPMPNVPGIQTGGGTAFAGDALDLVCEQLDMENPLRPRFVYILSDGGWMDTANGVKRIRRLAELGVPTIHISLGTLPPLSVEADHICVIDDPAEAMRIIADDTVRALRTQTQRPLRRPATRA